MSELVRIAGYSTHKLLGEGAFAEVWQVEHERRGWVRAAKVLHGPERLAGTQGISSELGYDGARERFEEEADILESLSHPNIVRLYDLLETDDGRPVLVLEYCPNSLAAHLGVGGQAGSAGRVETSAAAATGSLMSIGGSMGVDGTLECLSQVTEGLRHMHARDYLHGDVTPSNILLGVDGLWKLSDFGLASVLDPSGQTRAAAGMGKAYFVAPEQIKGQPDARSDLFSVGALAFSCLSGELPIGNLWAMRTDWPHVPDWLWTLMMELMGPIAGRPQTAAALLRRLGPAEAPTDTAATVVGEAPGTSKVQPEGDERKAPAPIQATEPSADANDAKSSPSRGVAAEPDDTSIPDGLLASLSSDQRVVPGVRHRGGPDHAEDCRVAIIDRPDGTSWVAHVAGLMRDAPTGVVLTFGASDAALAELVAQRLMVLVADRPESLWDLSAYSGAQVISPDLGMSPLNTAVHDLGQIGRIRIEPPCFVVVDGRRGDRFAFEALTKRLQRSMRHDPDPATRRFSRRRLEGWERRRIAQPEFGPPPEPPGYSIRLGGMLASPYFVNDPEEMCAKFEQADIVIVPSLVGARRPENAGVNEPGHLFVPDAWQPGSSRIDILPLLRAMAVGYRPFVLIVREIEPSPLLTLVVNQLRGRLNCAVFKIPSFSAADAKELADALPPSAMPNVAASIPGAYVRRAERIWLNDWTGLILP